MWEHRCTAANVNGTRCARESTIAQWCFRFQDWHSDGDGPSWAETCTQHAHHASEIVASLAIPSKRRTRTGCE